MSDALHEAAAIGFDRAGDVYERARPSYPAAIADAVVAAVPDEGPLLDLAAGTGKFTRLLTARRPEVIAAEPVAGMRRQLAGDGVPTVACTAERLPFADGSLAGVTVAQAFHWFDADAALTEIRRALVDGGVLALVFNVRDDAVGWVHRLWERLDVYDADAKIPRHRKRTWEPVLRIDGRFEPEGERIVVEHRQSLDVSGLIERVASVSFIAALGEEERERAFAIVRDVCAGDPELAGRERFEYPYRCELDLLRAV
jgi:SAM-dependent methyltransferase